LNEHKYKNLKPLEMISYLLCDENSSFEDYASENIGKVHLLLKGAFIEFSMLFQWTSAPLQVLTLI